MYRTMCVYQIGDYVVPNFYESALTDKFEIAQEPKALLFSPEKVFPIATYGNKEYSLSVSIVSNHISMVDQELTRLKGLRGRVVDIIGYLDLDDCPTDIGSEGEDPVFSTGLLWLTTIGSIQDVDVNEKDGKYTLEVTLSTQSFWKPMERFEWQYLGNKTGVALTYNPASFVSTPLNFLNPYIFWSEIKDYYKHGRLWVKRNIVATNGLRWDLDYNLWDDMVKYLRPGFPDIGKYDSIQLGQDSVIVYDGTLWNAEPTSFYHISLYDGSTPYEFGTWTFTIETAVNIWQRATHVVTLNLNTLDSDLAAAGLTGILAGDELYFGDWHVKPAFIKRGNQILTTYVNMVYDTVFPGALGGDNSRITMTSTFPIPHINMTLHHLHIFRRS